MKPYPSVGGIDLAKRVLHVVGMDDAGHVILRKRLPRDALMPFMTDIFQDIGGTDTITSATWGGEAEHRHLLCCGMPSGAAR